MEILSNENKKHFLEYIKTLNFHKINSYEVLNFMFRVKHDAITSELIDKFQTIDHIYPTRHRYQNTLVQSLIKCKQTKNAISTRRTKLLDNILQ